MFTDELRSNVWAEIRQLDLRCFAQRLVPSVVREAAGRAGVEWGRGPLNVMTNSWLAVASAWHSGKAFFQVLPLVMTILGDGEDFADSPLGRIQESGRRQAQRRSSKANKNNKKRSANQRRKNSRSGSRSKHDPRRDDPTQLSEAAFAKARERLPLTFWAALLVVLGEQFQQQHGRWLRWRGYRLLAMDGSTLKLPRYKALADHFDTARNGSTTAVPRARMVLLQFPLARIPYRYELVPFSEGETTVAERLVKHLQPNDLVLLDRGFWSYPLFAQMLARQAQFGIRLKSGLKLKTVRRLGRHERLVRWKVPHTQRKRIREAGLPMSLTLRVIDYQIPGFRPSAVVTSVTKPEEISAEDWIRLATQTDAGNQRLGVGLYHRRWEIETTFKELKVHQGMNSLRSRTPGSIHYEVAGHVLLYLLVRWMMVEAAETHGVDDPLSLSFSAALNELTTLWPLLLISSPNHVRHVLLPRLLRRIANHRVVKKPGRHFPRPHDTQPKNKGNGRYQQSSKL
jgi:hypothetical protein